MVFNRPLPLACDENVVFDGGLDVLDDVLNRRLDDDLLASKNLVPGPAAAMITMRTYISYGHSFYSISIIIKSYLSHGCSQDPATSASRRPGKLP